MEHQKMVKHNRTRTILKFAGLTLIVIGFVLIVIGFVDFFSNITSDDIEAPKKFWMFFVGFPTLSVGGTLLIFGSRRGIMTYMKNESIPVINDAINDLSGAFTNSAHSFKNGFVNNNIKCSCGALNKEDSVFCAKCGANLNTKCQKCGSENENNALYCNKCGAKIK